MQDLISIDNLSKEEAFEIFDLADSYLQDPIIDCDSLKSKVLVNFFFENSTRTRMSFEIAAKRMGAEVVNVDISLSSLKKGESIIDTSKTINAMRPDFVVIRHNSGGIVKLLKHHISGAVIINAGDGANEHPSQALLDAFTIRRFKGNFEGLKVAICGDVLHSRVARSNIKLLSKLGCNITVISPPTLVLKDYEFWLRDNWNVSLTGDLKQGIKEVDVIIMLRIQQERMLGCYIPSLSEYFKVYGLSHDNIGLAKDDVLVMHPGPINRDVEISSGIADDKKYSVILDQVEAGVLVRRAILKRLFG
ncbi:MAG: aspartate carbamoyltransferase catalytic subunit [Rickettsiales bacterium]|nr:aspartate carbamoyltransferase catalytic subunit [Rickettsiales bacterium]